MINRTTGKSVHCQRKVEMDYQWWVPNYSARRPATTTAMSTADIRPTRTSAFCATGPLFRLIATALCFHLAITTAAASDLTGGLAEASAASKFLLSTARGGGNGNNNNGYGLRPTPSLDLPVIDLIESPDKMYDPKAGDLDPHVLQQKMGANYDPHFMSIKKPLDMLFAPNGTLDFRYERTKKGMLVPVGKMPKEIRKLKFKFVHLPDGRKLRTKVTHRLRRKLRQFLWAYTHCPVMYVWKDLGSRFWPRWLREGHCFAGPAGPSCSFPPGQTCKPSKSVNKLILRWHCQDWDRARFCKWISVRYPVITGCACSC